MAINNWFFELERIRVSVESKHQQNLEDKVKPIIDKLIKAAMKGENSISLRSCNFTIDMKDFLIRKGLTIYDDKGFRSYTISWRKGCLEGRI